MASIQTHHTSLIANSTVKGIIALVTATLLFAIQDAVSKKAVQSIPVPLIMVCRYGFLALFACIYAARSIGLRTAFKTQHPTLQLSRGLLMMVESALMMYVFLYIGLSEVHTIFACFPLLVTALSVPLLGESVGWRRWLAVFLGFIGTLIILRPGSGLLSIYALLALLAAFLFSLYSIFTRKVSKRDHFVTSLLYLGLVGFIGSLFVAPFYWQPLSTDEMILIVVISLIAICAHTLVIFALQCASAVILQPFNYFLLVWVMIIGYLVYDERLDTITIVGAGIVVASGVFIAWREYVQFRASKKAAELPLNI